MESSKKAKRVIPSDSDSKTDTYISYTPSASLFPRFIVIEEEEKSKPVT